MITYWKCFALQMFRFCKARDGKSTSDTESNFKNVNNIYDWWYLCSFKITAYIWDDVSKVKQILLSHVCFGICCFQMLFLAVDRVLWKQTYFLTFFLLGELYIIRVPLRGGTEHLISETHSILLWPVVWEMCSHTAFLISLSCWLPPKPDLGRADSSGNVLFLVVLVFAKFSIKSVQQAKKPAFLLRFPLFFNIYYVFAICNIFILI